MNTSFLNACRKLNMLISQSNSSPITLRNGEEYSFSLLMKYTEYELEEYEHNAKINLPKPYKYFLKEVGICNLFIDEYDLGIVFTELNKIAEFTNDVFSEMSAHDSNLLLIASLTGRGDFSGFNLDANKDNFTIFSHEDDPELWVAETKNYSTFENWIINLVESDGEVDLP